MWFVYIVECADYTFYTGIAKDVEKRLWEHNSSALGAKYTRARRPIKLLYTKKFKTRSLAAKEECRIKKLAKENKRILIAKSKQVF